MKTTRKRLVYQVRKRGMLEGDLLLATFARDKLPSMTDVQVREFDKVSIPSLLRSRTIPGLLGTLVLADLERRELNQRRLELTFLPFPPPPPSLRIGSILQLLDEPDWDIYYWMTYKKPLPERWQNSDLIEQFVLLPPSPLSTRSFVRVDDFSRADLRLFGFLRSDFVSTPRTRVESSGSCLLSTICRLSRSEERTSSNEGRGRERRSSVGLRYLFARRTHLAFRAGLSISCFAFCIVSFCMTGFPCISGSDPAREEPRPC